MILTKIHFISHFAHQHPLQQGVTVNLHFEFPLFVHAYNPKSTRRSKLLKCWPHQRAISTVPLGVDGCWAWIGRKTLLRGTVLLHSQVNQRIVLRRFDCGNHYLCLTLNGDPECFNFRWLHTNFFVLTPEKIPISIEEPWQGTRQLPIELLLARMLVLRSSFTAGDLACL